MSVSKYDTDVDPASNTSHALMLQLVGSNKRVLDVGCASGYLARALREQGCRVSGVEYDPGAAEEARPALDKIVIGDLEQLDLAAEFAGDQFDVIVFGDVLEHLRDPLPVLRSVRELLRPGGAVVISVPNIAHADVRLSLLQGKFDYRNLGLLDITHVRFFTRSSLRTFLQDAGFVAVDVRTTTADVFGTELAEDAKGVDPAVVEQVLEDPDARTYQFVVKAVRDDAVQIAEELPWRTEELTRRLADAQVEVARLQAEIERMAAVAAEEERQREALESRLAHLRSELDAVYSTKVMRSVKMPRAVWQRLRRLQ
jgi:2-polyprenyl-3-methyl-5-hydroxy-6-metoxy-1,4-benzoquinol methylase